MNAYQRLFAATEADRAYLLAAPVIARALKGEITRDLYIAFLTQAYQHVRHTVPLLHAVAAHLPQRHAWLRSEVEHYVEEEAGHDTWILNDIEAAGGDRSAAQRQAPGVEMDALVAYAYDAVERINPVSFFGMAFVLEGASVALALAVAERAQSELGLPASAFSYLRSHGLLDLQHVDHLAGILERLTDESDQLAVERCARGIYWLYGNTFRALDRSQQHCSQTITLRKQA